MRRLHQVPDPEGDGFRSDRSCRTQVEEPPSILANELLGIPVCAANSKPRSGQPSISQRMKRSSSWRVSAR